MNVAQLKSILEDLDDDTEVRFGFQPSWPLQSHISMTTVLTDPNQDEIDEIEDHLNQNGPDMDDDEKDEARAQINEIRSKDSSPILYLLEGGQCDDSPYLPSNVQSEAGWGR